MVMGLAESRSNAHGRLRALEQDPELAGRISKDLVRHYESVARAGGPVATSTPDWAKPFVGRSEASLRSDLLDRVRHLPGASADLRTSLEREITELRSELARRATSPALGQASRSRPWPGGSPEWSGPRIFP